MSAVELFFSHDTGSAKVCKRGRNGLFTALYRQSVELLPWEWSVLRDFLYHLYHLPRIVITELRQNFSTSQTEIYFLDNSINDFLGHFFPFIFLPLYCLRSAPRHEIVLISFFASELVVCVNIFLFSHHLRFSS